jgi:hypothetical protein
MPDKSFTLSQNRHGRSDLIFAGLIGIGIFFVIDLISQTPLDTPLTIALYCFSFSIPFLALPILLHLVETTQGHSMFPSYVNVSIAFGVVGTICGLIAEIWHLSWVAGVLFLCCCTITTLFFWLCYSALKKTMAQEQDAS